MKVTCKYCCGSGYTATSQISYVYAIICEPTGERYIGASWSPHSRWKEHLKHLRGNWHHSKLLQQRFNQFGEHSLRFEILSDDGEEQRHMAEGAQLNIVNAESSYRRSLSGFKPKPK